MVDNDVVGCKWDVRLSRAKIFCIALLELAKCVAVTASYRRLCDVSVD